MCIDTALPVNNNVKTKTIAIACTAVRPELKRLTAEGLIDFPIHYISSSLHMRPDKLQSAMAELIEKEQAPDKRIVLIYGDCHPYIEDMTDGDRVARVRATNCVEMLLGKNRYKDLIKNGSFILLPEWTKRWHEIFGQFPGTSRETAMEILRCQHTNLVYANTGERAIPYEALKTCSAYTGLPFEIIDTSLDHLILLIKEALREL
jgi:Protein of unknown function (DUF1638)